MRLYQFESPFDPLTKKAKAYDPWIFFVKFIKASIGSYLVNNFENLIYISCNPDTYIRDIKLLNNFKVEKLALFDQFANTEHLEIVSILKKINQ